MELGTPRPGGGHSIHETRGALPSPPFPYGPHRTPKPAPVLSPVPSPVLSAAVPAPLPPLGAGSRPVLPDPSPVVRPVRARSAPLGSAPPAAGSTGPGSGSGSRSGMVLSVLAGVCLAATLAMFATGL